MSNRGLAEQPVATRIRHDRRVNIDWYQPDHHEPPYMLSWTVVSCWCKAPWQHY